MSDTTIYGDALPTARELWETLSDILASDLYQSVTGKEETTQAIGAAEEWLKREWPVLALYPRDMVSTEIYHGRDKEDWPYSQETTDEILAALDRWVPA